MSKKTTLQQKLKRIKKLDKLLSVVGTITALAGVISLLMAYILTEYFKVLFFSGLGCFVAMTLVYNLQERVAREEKSLNLKQVEEQEDNYGAH